MRINELELPELISYPPRHFVRRGELVGWMEVELGICAWQVRCWIEEGVIRGHRMQIYKRQSVYVPREVVECLRVLCDGD